MNRNPNESDGQKADPQKPLRIFESPYTNLMLEFFNASGDAERIQRMKKKISHSQKYVVKDDGNARYITYTGKPARKGEDNKDIVLRYTDISILTPDGNDRKAAYQAAYLRKNITAFFEFFTYYALDRAIIFRCDELKDECLTIPFREIADAGLSSQANHVKDQFLDAIDAIRHFEIKTGEQAVDDGYGIIHVDKFEPLFTDVKKARGAFCLYLNPKMKWGEIAHYVTIVPPYFFQLEEIERSLLYQIFYLARQKKKELDSDNILKFSISGRAIQCFSPLPDEESKMKNRNAWRDIVDVLAGAVRNINYAHGHFCHNESLLLDLQCDEPATTSNFLDTAKLHITLKGDLIEMFKEVKKSKEEKMAENAKPKAKPRSRNSKK